MTTGKEIEALRGAFRDGYTSEDVDRVFNALHEWTGLDLVCVWDKFEDGMACGDSDFYVAVGGNLHATPPDVDDFLATCRGEGGGDRPRPSLVALRCALAGARVGPRPPWGTSPRNLIRGEDGRDKLDLPPVTREQLALLLPCVRHAHVRITDYDEEGIAKLLGESIHFTEEGLKPPAAADLDAAIDALCEHLNTVE